MGEEKEKKKKKKNKDKDGSPPPEESEKKSSKKKSSKKGSTEEGDETDILACFTDTMLKEFKDGFNFLDQDKDGVITKNDLFRAYDYIGKLASDMELEELVNQCDGPMTFTAFLTMFAERMQGKADDDDVIIEAFKQFDEGDGFIEPDHFRDMCKGKGEPLTNKECDEIFPEIPRSGIKGPKMFYISLKGVIDMLINKGSDDEEEEDEDEPVPA